ncbi:hypothetical protein BW687_017785 [Pseudomonas graminis]|uniref:hypothetical protein n=1 Tax=Pseudomonas graminis TaxID=158627 RepID=UPI00234B286F|nr:hypothetical protein [Pseudomonas graminis]MDC6382022.1 hypothetical protein [Pseudomonas graminis]
MTIADKAIFSAKKFPDIWQVPKDLTGKLFIGGLKDGAECYYQIDFGQRVINSCIVDVGGYVSEFSRFIEANLKSARYPYGCTTSEELAYSFVAPHEALSLPDGRVVVAMHNCSFAREIDFGQQQVGSISEHSSFTPTMMSAQNSLDRATGDYLYAMTDMVQRFRSYGGDQLELDTELYSLPTNWSSSKRLASFKTLEAIHEVKQTPDPKYVALTEFCLAARAVSPQVETDPFVDPGLWSRYESEGLYTNQMYLIDKTTGSIDKKKVGFNTPGHVEFSRAHPDKFFLSCHNLSKARGKLILHGNATLLAGTIKGGIISFVDSYSPATLHRLTTHKLFSFKKERYIVLSAYPNKFHILREDSLELFREEKLYEHEPVPTSGLHFCTLLGHMPIWIETSDNGRYVILVSNELIYFYDMQDRKLRHVEGYNHHGKFFITAHMTNFNDVHY